MLLLLEKVQVFNASDNNVPSSIQAIQVPSNTTVYGAMERYLESATAQKYFRGTDWRQPGFLRGTCTDIIKPALKMPIFVDVKLLSVSITAFNSGIFMCALC